MYVDLNMIFSIAKGVGEIVETFLRGGCVYVHMCWRGSDTTAHLRGWD